tara:strand:+ start:1366 stop:3153 length:1788 start_codon:yes stop_codon:yes gene_type:complete
VVRKEIDVDVQPMEDILKYNAEYMIPLYQRDYSWKHDDHVEEFWIDLKNHYEQKLRTPYFFGTFMLVNEKETDENYTVVDGQQRLTTTIMLLTAFRDYFKQIGDDEQVEQLEKYLTTEDYQRQRLHVNVYNQPYFDNAILPAGNITEKITRLEKGEDSSTYQQRVQDKLLRNSYILLAKKITEYKKDEENKDLETIALKDNFLRYFTIVLNYIIDLQKAYVIFENINNKGLHLAQSDLVKNHLMKTIDTQSSGMPKGERRNLIIQADEKWQEIRRIVEQTKKKENEYLRWYLIAFVQTAAKEEVYSTIKEKYETKEQVEEFLDDLEKRVHNLRKIISPELRDWNDDQDTVDYLNALGKLSLGAMYPILLIAMEKITDKREMKQLIILVTKLFFRSKTVCSRNYSAIEGLVGDICKKFRSPEETTVKEIRNMIVAYTPVYPDDEEFKVMFRNLQLPDSKANYALSEIHYQMIGGRDSATMRISNKAQVEHIMPQTIKDTKWQDEIDEKHGFTNDTERAEYKKANLNKIGNLTLLNDKKNKKNSNKPFSEKKNIYARDDLKMTKELADIAKWDDDAISLRQDNFLPLALQIWNLKDN